MTFKIAIKSESDEYCAQAKQLAYDLSLPLADEKEYSALLIIDEKGLRLQQTTKGAPGPIYIDFVGGAIGHRLKFGGGKGQMITKAIGIKGKERPSILDVTAGMGRDGFILASLGSKVQMVERVPVIASLLQDGLRRAAESDETKEIASRISLHVGDSLDYLKAMKNKVDVIYMDPMFPQRQKSALVKKEMRIFRNLAGTDDDAGSILEIALTKAKKKVVIKRPRKSPYLVGLKPSYSLEGKSNRFDILLVKK